MDHMRCATLYHTTCRLLMAEEDQDLHDTWEIWKLCTFPNLAQIAGYVSSVWGVNSFLAVFTLGTFMSPSAPSSRSSASRSTFPLCTLLFLVCFFIVFVLVTVPAEVSISNLCLQLSSGRAGWFTYFPCIACLIFNHSVFQSFLIWISWSAI